MKYTLILFLCFTINNVNSQNLERDKEMRETINWIDKQFRDNSLRKNYKFNEIIYINNEPILSVIKTPGTCDEDEIAQIPIKKIKPVRFVESIEPHEYTIFFETKNGEEVIWYQSKDKSCGQIGDHTFFYLNESIEKDNLMPRLKEAFLYLMKLYGNDGKDKF